MVLISLQDVTKAYDPTRVLLEGVSLAIGEEDRIGLIGPNGAGKSTLLRLLAGLEAPDRGERVSRRDVRVGYLEQAPVFPANETVRSAVRAGLQGRDELLAQLSALHESLAEPGLEGDALERRLRAQERLQQRVEELGGHDVEHRVEATIDGVGLRDAEALCGTLSGGESRRVALARLLVSAPDLVLLDEPTNHLDAFVIAWLEERLARLDVPLVLVTHDRYLLERTVHRIVEIDRGSLYTYEGGYGRYLEERAARLEREQRDERSRLLLLRRETAWMRRGPPARSTKAKARIARYDALVADAPEQALADLEMSFPPGRRLGAKVLALRGVSHRYGDTEVLPQLDLELRADMRLGIVGPNGAGKTTLVEILLGKLTPTTGEVIVGETVLLASLDQRRSDLDPEKSVVREVAGKSDHVVVGERRVHVASFLDAFLFPGARKDVPIASLSGGEQARVLLAKLLLSGGNVLVLDEPTNDLDLPTLRALEEALVAFTGAVVVVSHDRWFLDRVATHVLHLDGKGGAFLHTGDASALLEKALDEQKAAREPAKKTRPAAPAQTEKVPAGPKKLSPWERRELDELTERVAALESELANLDERLADPALYQGDAEEPRRVKSEREGVQDQLASAMMRWEELAERDA